MIVEGQVHGGLAQGIGQALFESAVYDNDSGQLLSGSYMDYTMPRADDLCSFRCATHNTMCTHNPLGSKGVGEVGAIGSHAGGDQRRARCPAAARRAGHHHARRRHRRSGRRSSRQARVPGGRVRRGSTPCTISTITVLRGWPMRRARRWARRRSSPAADPGADDEAAPGPALRPRRSRRHRRTQGHQGGWPISSSAR